MVALFLFPLLCYYSCLWNYFDEFHELNFYFRPPQLMDRICISDYSGEDNVFDHTFKHLNPIASLQLFFKDCDDMIMCKYKIQSSGAVKSFFHHASL